MSFQADVWLHLMASDRGRILLAKAIVLGLPIETETLEERIKRDSKRRNHVELVGLYLEETGFLCSSK